jgi:uncharacterized protein (DUF433 family)
MLQTLMYNNKIIEQDLTERKLEHLRQEYEGRYRKRNFCITSYSMENYDEWITNWADIQRHGITYLCYQAERCPKTLKEHLQGYLECGENALDYNSIKLILNDQKLWIGSRIASQRDAINYTKKDDSRIKELPWIELGLAKNQGHRTDIGNVMTLLEEGKSPTDIREEYPTIYFKFSNIIMKMYGEYLKENIKESEYKIQVILLIGRPRTGKTSEVFRRHPKKDIYMLNRTSSTAWFDGYTNQKVLLIDDFKKGMFSLREILQFTDRYYHQYPIKNGFITKQWTYVYITSNYKLQNWFQENIMREDHEQHDAFLGRITTIETMNKVYDITKSRPKIILDGTEVDWNFCTKKVPHEESNEITQ